MGELILSLNVFLPLAQYVMWCRVKQEEWRFDVRTSSHEMLDLRNHHPCIHSCINSMGQPFLFCCCLQLLFTLDLCWLHQYLGRRALRSEESLRRRISLLLHRRWHSRLLLRMRGYNWAGLYDFPRYGKFPWYSVYNIQGTLLETHVLIHGVSAVTIFYGVHPAILGNNS